MCCRKNGVAVFSFISTYFSVKNAKREPNGKYIFKVDQLEMRPKRPTKIFYTNKLETRLNF